MVETGTGTLKLRRLGLWTVRIAEVVAAAALIAEWLVEGRRVVGAEGKRTLLVKGVAVGPPAPSIPWVRRERVWVFEHKGYK